MILPKLRWQGSLFHHGHHRLYSSTGTRHSAIRTQKLALAMTIKHSKLCYACEAAQPLARSLSMHYRNNLINMASVHKDFSNSAACSFCPFGRWLHTASCMWTKSSKGGKKSGNSGERGEMVEGLDVIPGKSETKPSKGTKKSGGSAGRAKGGQVTSSESQVCVTGAEGEDLGLMTKRKAEHLAEEEGMKLVLLGQDNTSGLPHFCLMTGKQLAEEQKRLRQQRKAEKKHVPKVILVTTKISDHDLQIKVKHAADLLAKGHLVKMVAKQASTGGEKDLSRVFERFTAGCQEVGQVQQAQHTSTEVQLMIQPLSQNQLDAEKKKLKPMTLKELKTN